MADRVLLLAALVSACLLHTVLAYPSGAPGSACNDLTPNHAGAKSQPLDTAKYELKVQSSTMEPGGVLQLTLQGKEETKFMGFFIVAKDEAGNNFGKMDVYYSYSEPFVTKRCSEKGLTHSIKWHDRPWHQLDFNWTAPADYQGKVKFYATALKTMNFFWVAIPGDKEVTVAEATQESAATTTTTQAPKEATAQDTVTAAPPSTTASPSDSPASSEDDEGAEKMRMGVTAVVVGLASIIAFKLLMRCIG